MLASEGAYGELERFCFVLEKPIPPFGLHLIDTAELKLNFPVPSSAQGREVLYSWLENEIKTPCI